MLIVRVLDESFPASLAAACLSGDPLKDGGGDGELCQFILKDDGVKGRAEVHKQDPHISP